MVQDIQLSHQIASAGHVPLARIHLDFAPAKSSGLFVAARSEAAHIYYVYENAFRVYRASDLPGFRLAASNSDWALWEKC